MVLGVPVHEYTGRDGAIAYGAAYPDGVWEDLGVAFHASYVELPGFSAVHRWERDGEHQYAVASPGAGFVPGDALFFVPTSPSLPDSPVIRRPVYAWHDGTRHLLSTMESGLEWHGLTRGNIAFYAP